MGTSVLVSAAMDVTPDAPADSIEMYACVEPPPEDDAVVDLCDQVPWYRSSYLGFTTSIPDLAGDR